MRGGGPRCRACGAALRITLCDLGATPLANALLEPTPEATAAERAHPLKVMVCSACHLAQTEQSPPPEAIFHGGYAYFSSYSQGWVAHARAYAEAMRARFGLGPQSRVVEAASNDGYLLQHFVAAGVPALGVEPAANTAAAARQRGVETRVAFFGAETARALVAEGWAADLTAANNVLAHVPDIDDFVAGFAALLKPEGVSTFEFPHLLELIEQGQFDTIYHEHYSYLSLLAVEGVFARHGLRAFDVERLSTHGGSLRVFACRAGASHAETPALGAIRAAEAAAGLDRAEGYAGFQARCDAMRAGFLDYLAAARAEGRRIAAYGAAAKGATFLNFCGVGADEIAFVTDRNPEKQGKLMPGSHIPIRPPQALADERPDDVLILPWNLAAEITAQHAYVRDWGGRFLVAAPEMRELRP
ncbi:MAG: class I SAM-dependent methyltransferase [Pseudomonadota bacterium]